MNKRLNPRNEEEQSEINPKILLIGASLVAQFSGVWLAGILLSLGHGGWDSLMGVLGTGLMILFIGFPFILLVWALVTLPLSAACMHFGIHQSISKTTLIGVVFGILAAHGLGIAGFGKMGLSLDTAIWGAVNGGLVAGFFSFFSKSWGLPATDD